MCATIFMVMMGYGIFIPVIPFYAGAMGAGGRDLGLLTATYAITQLLFSPVWGQVSDRIGRRPVLLIGVAGCVGTQLLYGLATHLWMFFVVRALAGAITSAVFPTAMAYIADATTPEERSGGMGLVTAAMYAGMMLGPGLGGLLANYGLAVPFFAAAALSAVVLLFVWLAVPESLPAELRSRQAARLPGAELISIGPALRGPLKQLFALSFVFACGMSQFWGIFGLYAARRFGYGPSQVGMVMAAMGVGSAIVQAFLVGRAARRWGEGRVLRFGLWASAVGFLAMLAPSSFTGVLLTTCLFVMAGSLVNPMIASSISRQTTQGQGSALGLNNSFMSLGQIAGPIWAGLALDLSVLLPFASGAVVMGLGGLVSLGRIKKQVPELARSETGQSG